MPQAMPATQTQRQPAPAAKAAAWRMPKIGPMILVGCLLLAIMTVLFIPMAVSGTVPASSRAVSAQAPAANFSLYSSPEEAAAVLGIEAALPVWPEGASLADARVLDGTTLEVDIAYAGSSFVYRAAAGNADLSGLDYETVAFTATEDTAGMSVGYAGPSEKKLSAAVWVAGDCSHALVSPAGVDSEAMKALAAAIA